MRELTHHYLTSEKLDHNAALEAKVMQLYEITQVKVGCIVLGDAQSAKTTLISTLSGALNIASNNELKLLVAQERKQRLKESVIESQQALSLLSSDVIKYWKK